jgi:hypothetical protein
MFNGMVRTRLVLGQYNTYCLAVILRCIEFVDRIEAVQ